MDILLPPLQPPFICKISSGRRDAEGWFKSSLGSTAERGMRGCSVSVKRLIANVFWLICKDEWKRRNDRLGEGGSIFPYIKNIPGFLKKMVMFLRNIKVFFENIKVFFAAWECVKTKPCYPIVSCRGEVHSPENSLLCVFGQATPAPTNQKTALSTF